MNYIILILFIIFSNVLSGSNLDADVKIKGNSSTSDSSGAPGGSPLKGADALTSPSSLPNSSNVSSLHNPASPANPDDALGIQAMLSEPTENERSSSLSFEGSFVEGLNSNPFERLTSLGKKDDRDEGHLYHRKVHFNKEMRQTAREVGFLP